VFRLGQFEYSYTFRDAPSSTRYSTLRYGAYIKELRSHLVGFKKGGVKYRHNIAHDGSVSPLLGILQIDEMVWPGTYPYLRFTDGVLMGRGRDGIRSRF
jgi:hypothetical protein